MNVPASSLIQLELVNPSDVTRQRAERWDASFNRLARISGTVFPEKASQGAAQLVVGDGVVALPLKGVIDLAAEKARLDKEIAKADADIKRVFDAPRNDGHSDRYSVSTRHDIQGGNGLLRNFEPFSP